MARATSSAISTALLAVLLLTPDAARPAPAAADTCLSRKEALKVMFPSSDKVRRVSRTPTDEQRKRIAKALGVSSIPQKKLDFYVGETGGEIDGYALILDERGKYRPITFLVGIDPKGKVKMVEILRYREPVGGEVRHPRFLRQFKGKGTGDPIRIRKDIRNVSGATISCEAICRGVRKSVALVNVIFLEAKRPPAEKAPRGEEEGAGRKRP